MNKRLTFVLVVLATVLVASCAPATTAPVATVVAAPPAAKTSAPAPVVASPAAATPDTRPVVPAPAADGSRPLAKLSAAERMDRFSGPAATVIKPGTIHMATMVTDKGNIVVELYGDTPLSANNFVTLSQNGYYDGLTFHRVDPGFVVQGGDPKGDGGGGPGYTIPAEIKHTHPRGALAWARTGDQVNPQRRSSGSQFYITLDATPDLNGGYTVFGYVVEGMDVVDKIAVGDKITRIDISETSASRLPTPTPTPQPKAPVFEAGRPLASMPLEQRENLYNTAPAMAINPAKTYQATVETARGVFVLDLDAKAAPIAVNSFVVLANLGYFDGMPIAYVEPEVVALFGSPASQPDSHVGYLVAPEVTLTSGSIITGTVVLYPIADPETGRPLASASEAYLTMTELPSDGSPLAILGKVSSGLDVVMKLEIGDLIARITISEK